MANYTMTIQEMIDNPLCTVFPKSYPFYCDDTNAKAEFEEKFINHFMYREIGFETPYQFNQRLYALFLKRMPYYEQLYLTEWNRVGKDMMNSKDLTETTTRTLEETSNGRLLSSGSSNTSSNSSLTDTTTANHSTTIDMTDTINQTVTTEGETTVSGTTSDTTTSTNNNTHKESMIRDGVASVSLDNGYLTGSSQDNGTTSNESSITSTQTTNDNQLVTTGASNTQVGTNALESKQSQTNTQEISQNASSQSNSEQQGNRGLTETTTFHSYGDIGIQTPAYAITEWRKVILNIDEMILNECESLFMKIY